MPIDFQHLFSLKYLFAAVLPDFQPSVFKTLIILFGLLLLLSAAARIVGHKKRLPPLKKFWLKLANWFLMVSLLGFLLVFFRQQHVAFLAMPIWLAGLGLCSLIWLIFILRYVLVKVPRLKEEIETKKQLEKYLP